MTDNQENVSIYEDAMSHINTKSQVTSNRNNDVSQYEECIDIKDYCEESHGKINNNDDLAQNEQNKIMKISTEEKDEILLGARNTVENSFEDEKKFDNVVLKKPSDGFNSGLSRNNLKKASAQNTNEGK